MEETKKYNIIIVGLVILIFLSMYNGSKLTREIEHLQNRVSNIETGLNQSISSFNYTISEEIERLLDEQQNIVSDYRATYDGLNTQNETVRTLFEFSLKESEIDSKVYLSISTQDNMDKKDYDCTSVGALSYACEADLSYRNNYTINIYQETPDGGYKKLNYHPYLEDIKYDFENRVSMLESGGSTDSEKTEYTFKLQNRTFGAESLKIKTVVLKTFYEGREVLEKDITAYNIVNAEARDRINLAIAAGDSKNMSLPEVEYGKILEDEESIEYGVYKATVLHSEAGVSAEYGHLPEYEFKVIITFNNGDTYEIH